MVYFNNLLFAVLDSSFFREGFSAALEACSDEVTQAVICTGPGKGTAVQYNRNQLHGIHSTLAAWVPKSSIELIAVIFFWKIFFARTFWSRKSLFFSSLPSAALLSH